jgi:hypothetical protein
MNVTKSTIEAILSEHNITTAYFDILSCFFHKVLNLEEALCVPFQQFRSQEQIGMDVCIQSDAWLQCSSVP